MQRLSEERTLCAIETLDAVGTEFERRMGKLFCYVHQGDNDHREPLVGIIIRAAVPKRIAGTD